MKELIADVLVLLMQVVLRDPDALNILERVYMRVGAEAPRELFSEEMIIGLKLYNKYLWLIR